jgi:hypothetical protein
MVQVSHLLTIQKFIYLLNDFHYSEFVGYLSQIKAELPLKLSQLIRQQLPAFDTPETLCRKIYGDYETNDRLAFNQLASYTFKLSSNLAINYPAYLTPNYQLLQQQVNNGNIIQADFLAKILLDIAEKIEDYPTQIFTLKFLVQQAFLMKQASHGVKLISQLDDAYAIEKIMQEIFSVLRISLNIAIESKVSPQQLEDYKALFRQYHEHPSSSLRMLSKYAYVYATYYHESPKFKSATTKRLIREIERDLANYSHVVFPFGFDLKSNFSFYKLNSNTFDLNSKEGKKDFEELEKHYRSVKFWNSYLNIPEIFAIALKASDYLTAYHHYVHRTDYYKIIPPDDLKQIELLAGMCDELLKHPAFEKYYKNDLINLHLLHCGLMILSGGPGIPKGAEELESMLVSYQQVNLAGTTDSIFLFLMIAYFAMHQYETCASTFKRYVRSTKGKTVYHENDTEIRSYYYLSQWLLFKRQQYLVKLESTYQSVFNNGVAREQAKAIKELITYFEVPLDLQ